MPAGSLWKQRGYALHRCATDLIMCVSSCDAKLFNRFHVCNKDGNSVGLELLEHPNFGLTFDEACMLIRLFWIFLYLVCDIQ